VIDIVCAENSARELLEEIILFVCRGVRADHPDRGPTFGVANLFEFGGDDADGVLPCGGFERAFGVADEGLGEALL
jgi:hypothetical protein